MASEGQRAAIRTGKRNGAYWLNDSSCRFDRYSSTLWSWMSSSVVSVDGNMTARSTSNSLMKSLPNCTSCSKPTECVGVMASRRLGTLGGGNLSSVCVEASTRRDDDEEKRDRSEDEPPPTSGRGDVVSSEMSAGFSKRIGGETEEESRGSSSLKSPNISRRSGSPDARPPNAWQNCMFSLMMLERLATVGNSMSRLPKRLLGEPICVWAATWQSRSCAFSRSILISLAVAGDRPLA
ncbi:hypothetical protein PFISCL1PPCAC_13787, partial [Pristionchus fissidentatus]